MAEIPSIVVSMPSQLFTMARSLKAVANGKIYVGKIDTDPTIPENQIQVYLEHENGSTTPVAQPIIINSGGYPVYGGQISKFLVEDGHSMAVYDSFGAQQFYFPNVLTYSPSQLKNELASNAGAGMIGTTSGQTVQQALDAIFPKLAANTGAGLIGSSDGRTVEEHLLAVDSAEYRSINIRNLCSAYYKLRAKSGLKVLCQGDSITAGFDNKSTDITAAGENGDWATHANITFPERLTFYLYEQSGCPITTTVRAISGYTALQAYQQGNWQDDPNCDIVLLQYGINDSRGVAGQNHASYLLNMEKLIRRFIKWGIGVIIVQPAGTVNWSRCIRSGGRRLKTLPQFTGAVMSTVTKSSTTHGRAVFSLTIRTSTAWAISALVKLCRP